MKSRIQASGRRAEEDSRRRTGLPQLTAGSARALLRSSGGPYPEIPEQGAPADAPAPGMPAPKAWSPAARGLAADGPLARGPAAARVLAVVARPGQESADLGAILVAFRLRGALLSVLCLTRGEGSEVNSTCEQLESLRPWELRVAASMLGVSSVTVADYPDGRLGYVPPAGLAERIVRSIRHVDADLLLVLDPAAGADLDTAAVARAALVAAREAGLPVLARTVAGPGQRWLLELGEARADVRERQRRAVAAHRSQRQGLSAADADDERPVTSRTELLRWLVPPSAEVARDQAAASPV